MRIKKEDIRAVEYVDELSNVKTLCCDCFNDYDNLDNYNHSEILTEDDLERDDEIVICDECNKTICS